jgi:hypothetical protein
VPAMTRHQWARLDPDARVRWVRVNLPDMTEDGFTDWLESLPK